MSSAMTGLKAVTPAILDPFLRKTSSAQYKKKSDPIMIETLKEYWLRIWKEPRFAIRELLDITTPAITIFLVALFGITMLVERSITRNSLDTIAGGALFFIVLVIGPVAGALIWIMTCLFTFGGSRLFGGLATFKETMIGVTWGTVPYISKWVLLFPMLLIFRGELFTQATPVMDQSFFLSLLHLIFLLLDLTMTVLSLIILSKIIGEINDFSAWKGFFSVILIPGVLFLLLLVRVILF